MGRLFITVDLLISVFLVVPRVTFRFIVLYDRRFSFTRYMFLYRFLFHPRPCGGALFSFPLLIMFIFFQRRLVFKWIPDLNSNAPYGSSAKVPKNVPSNGEKKTYNRFLRHLHFYAVGKSLFDGNIDSHPLKLNHH